MYTHTHIHWPIVMYVYTHVRTHTPDSLPLWVLSIRGGEKIDS